MPCKRRTACAWRGAVKEPSSLAGVVVKAGYRGVVGQQAMYGCGGVISRSIMQALLRSNTGAPLGAAWWVADPLRRGCGSCRVAVDSRINIFFAELSQPVTLQGANRWTRLGFGGAACFHLTAATLSFLCCTLLLLNSSLSNRRTARLRPFRETHRLAYITPKTLRTQSIETSDSSATPTWAIWPRRLHPLCPNEFARLYNPALERKKSWPT